MRPRLAWLLVLLGLVSVCAWIVNQRHGAAIKIEQARTQAAIARYTELEAQAIHREETAWKPLENASAADIWWDNVADNIMATPNNWLALHDQITRWPELAPLRADATRDQAAHWNLARFTIRPHIAPPNATEPGQIRHQLELLLARGEERAVIQATVRTHPPSPTTPDRTSADWSPQRLELLKYERREGRIQFRQWAEFTATIPTNTFFADPMLFHETPNGPELILISAGQRWRWVRSAYSTNGLVGDWIAGPPLEGIPRDHALAAALADMDSDGWSDLCLAGRDGLWVARGNVSGGFEVPVLRWRSSEPVIHPQSLAIADIDGDGDLDVWITQYKNPYQKGQFPTPYYDATDGFNSYLLRNDGSNGFTDTTIPSGLSAKRHRRAYSASWIDVNGDGVLDLVNVSDFAGIDVYSNDGHGRFTDVTAPLGESHYAFGMAHAVIDWNHDAIPDLLLVGMDSPWAARLDEMKLGLPDFPEHQRQRGPMTWGNRVFLGSTTGLRAETSTAANSLAKVGWGWSGVELDIENDGRPDLFFATGHETRGSQRDYERQFWLHDIYAAGSTNDPAAELYFQAATGRRVADHSSYGGWQHQALMRATGDAGFVESSWLAGVGLLADGRNAIAADFDGDGRVDLAITTVEGWPHIQQRLVIFRNETVEAGHWIGFRFREGPGRKSAVNSRVELQTSAGIRRKWFVTGDGYRTQQTVQAHFGLGTEANVRQAIITWADGSRTTVGAPLVDRWHEVP